MQEIPIENEIRRFRTHLESNSRAVLSARFGDGKSYFLKKVKQTLSIEYHFITLYPINYSVAQNEDVFEYIKRDILLQLAKDKLLDEVDFIALADSIFSWENLREVISFLLSFVPGGSVYDKLLSKAEGFHKKYEEEKSTWKKYNDTFTMQRGGLYECDGYTKFIQEAIKYVQLRGVEAKSRKSILIIEDLDRIDPKHLFRILNVLGAHIDEDKNTNKFGFDNIVVVMDYEITEHIFHHFYGKEANYSGYISKFMSCYPFKYSIKQVADDCLYDYIEQECGLPKDVVASMDIRSHVSESSNFSSVLAEKSVRDVEQVLGGIENQYSNEIIDLDNGLRINSSSGIIKLLAVLIRMNISLDVSVLFNSIKKVEALRQLNLLGDFMLINSRLSSDCFEYKGFKIRPQISIEQVCTCKFIVVAGGSSQKINIDDAIKKAFNKSCEYVKDLR